MSELITGVQYGPYPAAPEELVEQYIASRFERNVSLFMTNEQIAEDVQSEWQYDQHSAAVEAASERGDITPGEAIHMLEKVLRPWFIGRRTSEEAYRLYLQSTARDTADTQIS